MISKSTLNFLGGIPDQIFVKSGKLLINKSTVPPDVYLKSLEYYLQFETNSGTKSLFSLPDKPPSFEIAASNGNISEGINYIFNSRYTPQNPIIASDFNIHKLNKTTSLRTWEHGLKVKPPIVLCLHGFMLGNPMIAKKMFKIDKLFNAGVDVALYTLPHHGQRTNSFINQHLINQHNIPLTIEGMAQAIHDLHSSILILKELGYKKIGLIGASLGSLTSIIYSALSNSIDFIFTVVPAVDLTNHLLPTRRSFNYKITDQLTKLTKEIVKLITPKYYHPEIDVNQIGTVIHSGDKLNSAELTREWISSWNITNVTELPGGHWLYSEKKLKGKAWYSWLKKQKFIF